MDKNLFELLVYTFSLYGDCGYKVYRCMFYNSPLYKGFDDIKTEYFNYFDKVMTGGDQNEASE